MDLDDARDLALALLARHGLDDWTVRFDRAKRRAGVCRHGERVIGLSGPLTTLHDAVEVRDTILHEIAHALVGPEHGHDAVWRQAAREIGCSGTRCVDAAAPRVAGAWVGTCPAGHRVERHRRPERVASCPRCAPGFDLAHLLEWTHHGRPAPLHPNYEAELAALRAGQRHSLLGCGRRVRVITPGRFHGAVGVVEGRHRTRYTVDLGGGVRVRAPFAGVEPA